MAICRMDCDGQGQVLEDMYYMTFTYTYTYYTTYEQESIVDEQVRAVLDELDVYEDSEYEKAEAVYDYVCSTVSYDYDNLNNSDYKLKYTAYAALIDHKAVCQDMHCYITVWLWSWDLTAVSYQELEMVMHMAGILCVLTDCITIWIRHGMQGVKNTVIS